MKLRRNKLFWIAISVLSLSVFSTILAVGIPYLWSQPVREVSRIQDSLPVEERLSVKEKAELIDKKRGTLISGIGTGATIVGGIVLLVNVGLAVQKLKQDTDKNETDKKLAEDRLISERFSKAIEQLGSDNIHVRLGGIYSLERIARDSPGDQWTVMEVLTAFIREKSPYKKREDLSDEEEDTENSNISTDAQAALTVLGRRTVDNRAIQPLDLSKTNLKEADLRGAKFFGAVLCEAYLYRADLRDAKLIAADLRSDLRFANMQNADLRNAILSGADLGGADLSGADLSGAILLSTKLISTKLIRTKLSGAQLKNAEFMGALLIDTDLDNTDLSDVKNLTGNQINNAGYS